ncbi:MAG: ion transporter [Gammaproteobacteria bacterium]|nr:ion transporter [Gammaproteobacteria bacterium]
MLTKIKNQSTAYSQNLREKLKYIIEQPYFYISIMALIIVNTIVLGLESYESMMDRFGPVLITADKVMVMIFAAELAIYLYVHGLKKCFTDPWFVFDFIIVGIALFSFNTTYSSLRAMRVLRILRLITRFPNLRKVVQGLIDAMPGIGSIIIILIILVYVASLMGHSLFGAEYPEHFGNLQKSLLTLFQVMLSDNVGDIMREVMKTHPYAWLFFLAFLLTATFIVLNLFVAVTVDAMQQNYRDSEEEQFDMITEMKKTLKKLDEKISKIK